LIGEDIFNYAKILNKNICWKVPIDKSFCESKRIP